MVEQAGHDFYTCGLFAPRGLDEKDTGQYDEPAPTAIVSAAAAMYRRAAVERVGAFDEDYFLYCEDADLCLRMLLAGNRGLYVPGPEAYHVRGGTADRSSETTSFFLFRNGLITLLKDMPASVLDPLAAEDPALPVHAVPGGARRRNRRDLPAGLSARFSGCCGRRCASDGASRAPDRRRCRHSARSCAPSTRCRRGSGGDRGRPGLALARMQHRAVWRGAAQHGAGAQPPRSGLRQHLGALEARRRDTSPAVAASLKVHQLLGSWLSSSPSMNRHIGRCPATAEDLRLRLDDRRALASRTRAAPARAAGGGRGRGRRGRGPRRSVPSFARS